MTTLIAYHNDPLVKQKFVRRFAQHRAADEVIQGQGFDNGRGCFVGCTLDDYDHSRFPTELGWPQWLAHLADAIFEGIPKTEAPQFGTDILDAVPVGANLEPIRARFLLTVQRRDLARLAGNNAPYAAQVRAAIEGVISLLEDPAPTEAARSAARSAAWSAAWSAESAWSAARSAARSAAWSAWSAAWSASSAAWSARSAAWSARSAAESARSAAWSAARSAAWSAWSAAWSARSAAWSARSAAESAEYRTQRDDLLAMLRESDRT